MFKLRVHSVAVLLVIHAVILAGCATVPGRINGFVLQSHKFPDQVYGPFNYEDGAEVSIGKSGFTVVLNAELVQARSFKLRSHKFEDRVYGPYKCRPGEKLEIGKSTFTISATN